MRKSMGGLFDRSLKIAAVFVVFTLLVWAIGSAGHSAADLKNADIASGGRTNAAEASGGKNGTVEADADENGTVSIVDSADFNAWKGAGVNAGLSSDTGNGTGDNLDDGAGGGSAGDGGDSSTGGDGNADGTVSDTIKVMAADIVRFSSYDDLAAVIKENIKMSYSSYRGGVFFTDDVAIAMPGSILKNGSSAADGSVSVQQAAEAQLAGSVAGDHSITNVQVEGVDEADIVKTDGEYIYQVNRGRVIITRAYPAQEMETVAVVEFSDNGFSADELYISENMFIVIGKDRLAQPRTEAEQATAARADDASAAGASAAADRIAPYSQAVSVRIYSTIDIRKPVLTRTVAVDGYYVSSRKIADTLYIITNKNAYNYSAGTPEPVIPIFRDSAVVEESVRLPYDKMYYFPGTEMSSYIVIGTIPLKNTGEAAKISAYLGAGDNIYSSAGNLYIAAGRYSEVRAAASNISDATDVAPVPDAVIRYDLNTLVLKFTLTPNGPEPANKGEVPGSVLNQFSMDEYLGYFRIATTKGDVWGTAENISKNNIYVLDGNMNIAGKIEDIAPGEKIYSARFMGARAYMVTFRITDPLFVIDLGDPAAPKILGALKIPGYSDYLHPYDENHLIGFGKDTAEVSNSTFGGDVESTMSFYQGIKMALFDVTDPANPVQKFSVIIGDRGTDSELLRNHKALLFSKEKNIIAFPVTLYEKSADTMIQGDDLYKATQYGQFTFQGAYVYSLDPDEGFVLKGRVTHMTENDYLKAGSHYYTSEKAVKRIIYIKDTLYTLSDSVIMANLTEGLVYAGQVRLP